jgi:hypothetical protein
MSTSPPPRRETAAAVLRVATLIGYPDEASGVPISQDWDLILADHMRVLEFCDLYERADFDAATRFALMMLILVSVDDLMREGASGQSDVIARVERLLRRNFLLHLHTIDYWCVRDEGCERFHLTPLMREVWRDCFRPEYRQWLEDEEC